MPGAMIVPKAGGMHTRRKAGGQEGECWPASWSTKAGVFPTLHLCHAAHSHVLNEPPGKGCVRFGGAAGAGAALCGPSTRTPRSTEAHYLRGLSDY